MNRRLALALGSALMAGLVAAPASAATLVRTTAAAEVDASENVKRIAHFPYENKKADFFAGGTDIAFSGRYVYAMQQGADGGVHIFDNSGATPKKLSFFPCPTTSSGQNDVAVVQPGLIAIGYHGTLCGGPGAGVRLIDVRDPKHPKLLGSVETPGGTHTLTTYPGKPIIYASPGGLANGGGTEQIIDVSNPSKPKIVATFKPNGPIGCHDLEFYVSGKIKIAGCAGAGEAQLWDVSDPLAPVTTAHIPVPAQFPHSFAFTDDGKYAVIGDEAIAGNDCSGGPTGALWVYDISIPQPALVGWWGPQRGQLPAGSSNYNRNTWCSAHLFNFVPGTYTLVASWYSGGMSVIDFSNPTLPTEVAHYMGTGDDVTNYWSAYWYDGRIWANDRVKGLDVFTVKGLKEGKHKP